MNATYFEQLLNGSVFQNNTDEMGLEYQSNFKDMEYHFPDTMDLNRRLKTYSYHEETRRALRNVITPIICTFGFLGNVVNIIVLSRLRLLRREARRDGGIHFGLIALAFSDMLFCVSMFPRLMVSESSSIFSDKNFRWFYQVKNPPDLISYTLQEEHTLLTGYHQPTKLREGNVFSHVCLSDSHSVHRRGTHCARAPSPGPLFTGHYMFKLVKLWLHFTRTPLPQTCSNLFNMNRIQSSSWRLECFLFRK